MDWMSDLNVYQVGGIFLSGWVAFGSMLFGLWRLLAKGKLRTEREVVEIRASADKAEEKADTWRQAWQERERTVNILLEQQSRLLKVSEVSSHVLESLPKPGGGGAP